MHQDLEYVDKLLDAMLRLKAKITAASELHLAGDENRRKALVYYLHAVAEFVQSDPVSFKNDLVIPIANALSALQDLDDGRQSPLFKPVSFMNRHIDPMTMRGVKAYAAWTLDLMEQAGFETRSAACDIETLLSRYVGPIGNPKSRRGGTVINWRKTLRSKNAEHLSGEIYRERAAFRVEMNLDDKAAVRLELLTKLENILKGFGFRAENNAPT
jgi:hypothetical protein